MKTRFLRHYSIRPVLAVFALVAIAGLGYATSGDAPGVYDVTLINPAGEPLHTPVAVHDERGQLIHKGTPDRDGSFLMVASPGAKLLFSVAGAETLGGRNAVGFIVPPHRELRGEFNVGMPALAPIRDTGGASLGGPSCAGASADLTFGGSDADDSTGNPAPDPDAFDCGTLYDGGPGAWYRITGTGNVLTASTCNPGSAFDTKISVFQDCEGCSDLICVDGNDDDFGCSNSLLSTVSWCSVAGQDYLVFVHGFAGDVGAYEVSLVDEGTPCSGDACPEPVGACCNCLNAPFDCSVETLSDCAAIGGEYRGDGTTCESPFGTREIHDAADVPQSVPDGVGPPAVSTLSVASRPEVVSDVDVTLDIAHSFVGDLVIDLTHDGRTARLWASQCGSSDDIRATCDDDGTETDCANIGAGPSDAVRFSPVDAGGDPLAVFNGTNAEGDWLLTVDDTASGDVGVLEAWSIDIALAEPRCASSASSAGSHSFSTTLPVR